VEGIRSVPFIKKDNGTLESVKDRKVGPTLPGKRTQFEYESPESNSEEGKKKMHTKNGSKSSGDRARMQGETSRNKKNSLFYQSRGMVLFRAVNLNVQGRGHPPHEGKMEL